MLGSAGRFCEVSFIRCELEVQARLQSGNAGSQKKNILLCSLGAQVMHAGSG